MRVARLKLRRSVEPAKRRFAGAIVCNMRDAGFDDKEIVHVLQALFPPLVGHQSPRTREAVLGKAWVAFGGGDLVQVKTVAHDFRMAVADAGGIAPLVATLGQESIRAQEQAAGALASLALDNTKNELSIATMMVTLLASDECASSRAKASSRSRLVAACALSSAASLLRSSAAA